MFPEFLTALEWLILAFVVKGQFGWIASLGLHFLALGFSDISLHSLLALGIPGGEGWGQGNAFLSHILLAVSMGCASRILSFFWNLSFISLSEHGLYYVCRFKAAFWFASESFPLLALLTFFAHIKYSLFKNYHCCVVSPLSSKSSICSCNHLCVFVSVHLILSDLLRFVCVFKCLLYYFSVVVVWLPFCNFF